MTSPNLGAASMPSRHFCLTAIAALLASACPGSKHNSDNFPRDLVIDPIAGYSSVSVPVTITGAGFLVRSTEPQGGGPSIVDTSHRAWLETKGSKRELNDVTLSLDRRTLSATVPPGLEAGTYDLTVENALGNRGTREGAYTAIDTPPFSVTASVDHPSVNVGQALTLTVTVTNSGSGEIADFTLGTPVLGSSDGGAASLVAAPDVPSRLGAGEQLTRDWSYTASQAGHISITVLANGVDPVTGDAVVSALAAPVEVVVHQPPAALTSELSASTTTPNVGEGVTMTLHLANAANAAAADVTAVTPVSSASMVCPAAALASSPVRIAGGATETFTWTCTATAQCNYTLSAEVSATDVTAGTSVTTSVTGVSGMVMRIVYRWWNSTGGDHFYTLDADSGPAASGYVGEGPVFRMYPAGTPGTTPFLRYWSGTASDHFYTASADEGAGAVGLGYTSEGDIGNIGTSPLPGSIALQRYWNAAISDHFYTTDSAAPDPAYQPEGIAGYVLPYP
ncbi:MAG: hypothetical protein A2V77_20095 [Anaeromyxobacter sp. RBG_16_69_14]|nr:MAG: hypothetical protein A2V77_20095 [Anaeromyxobacter sp. RBG_16_69_14]